MNVDPVDDCTFWYVNQWVPTTSSVGWQLRIGSFKFNECGTPDFTLAVTPDSQEICVGANAAYTVNIGSVSGYNNPVTLSAVGQPRHGRLQHQPGDPARQQHADHQRRGRRRLQLQRRRHRRRPERPPDTVGADRPGRRARRAGADRARPTARSTCRPRRPSPGTPWPAPASYSIQVATDAGFTNIVASASGLASPTWTSNVDAEHQHDATTGACRPTNACGTGTLLQRLQLHHRGRARRLRPRHHAQHPLPVRLRGRRQRLDLSGTGNTWAIATTNPHSGTSHYHATDPATVSDQRLVSPAVALPTGQNPVVLKFWHVPNLENSGATACYDGGILEVSTDGGTTWTQVPNANLLVGPYTGAVSASFGNPLAGLQAWCGDDQPTSTPSPTSAPMPARRCSSACAWAPTARSAGPGWDVDDVIGPVLRGRLHALHRRLRKRHHLGVEPDRTLIRPRT